VQQRSFSNLGGILGIITFFGLLAAALADHPADEWSLGSSPLTPALWIAVSGILVLFLSRTALKRVLPIKTLGMWTFAIAISGAVAAVILLFRGEGSLSWKMFVLGASGWFAQFLIGIPYRAQQESAISLIAHQLGTSRGEVIDFFCSQLASAEGDPRRLAMSVTDDPRLASIEHAAIDEVVAEHCREHRAVWEAAKRILGVEEPTRPTSGRTLIEQLTSNPSMDPDQIMEAMWRQVESSERFLAAAASAWPERNEYGWPKLTADILLWRERQPEWTRASLEASLSPGVMTSAPNLMFRIEPNDGSNVIGSQSVYLLARPDLSQELPCYEVRWSNLRTYQQDQALIASESANLALLADYLEAHWAPVFSAPALQKPRLVSPEPLIFPPNPPPA